MTEDTHANLNEYPQSHTHELAPRSGTMNNNILNRLLHTEPKNPDSPDNDWNDHSEILGAIIIFFILAIGLTAGMICADAVSGLLEAMFREIPDLFPISIGLFEMILFALMIESTFSRTSSWIRKLYHTFNVLFFLLGAFFTKWFFRFPNTTFNPNIPFFRMLSWDTYLFPLIGVGAYILCAIWLRAMHGR